MNVNLYLVRHGKINTEVKNRREYLHLSPDGVAFSAFLNKHFEGTYFDHIFYQSIDIKSSDPYNKCHSTIRGMKGIKSEIENTRMSMCFGELNAPDAGVQNVMICFRAEGFNVLSNILGMHSDEEFNKDYNRIFHFTFSENHYHFVSKLTAKELENLPGA